MSFEATPTRYGIAGCFVDLVCDSPNPWSRIKVSEIVDMLGISRKTFYNQFDDTSDLVRWIFRDALRRALEDEDFALAELDYPAKELDDKYARMPFYARFRRSDGTLDQSRYFQALCAVFNERERYYRNIFTYPCYIDFYKYIESLYVPAFRKDVLIMAGENRKLSDAELTFLSEYHAIAVLYRVKHHLSHMKQPLPEKGVDRFWNYSHEVIGATLDAMFNDVGGNGVIGRLTNL